MVRKSRHPDAFLNSLYFIPERGRKIKHISTQDHAIDQNLSRSHAAGAVNPFILLNGCSCKKVDWCASAMTTP